MLYTPSNYDRNITVASGRCETELYSCTVLAGKYQAIGKDYNIFIDNIFTVFAGLFGLAVGSFLNVVSWRAPLGRSVVSPPSACPECQKQIEPRDNIPLLSYILLRGKCRHCSVRISAVYPATELVTGILFVLAALHTGYSLQFIPLAVLLSLMVVVFRTDTEEYIILDEVSIGGTAAGILLSLLPGGITLQNSLTGAAGGFLFFLLIRTGASIYLRQQNIRTQAPEGYQDEEDEFQGGMGWGDVKLAGCIGAFLGPERTAIAFFTAFITGAVTGGILVLFKKQKKQVPVPFGPFMAAGAAIAAFFGQYLWNAYLDLISAH